jgi:N-methylhydantoinase A
LTSPRQRELVRSWPTPGDRAGLDEALEKLGAEAAAAVGGGDDVEVTVALDCRYAGQSFELTVGSVAAFHGEHRRRNGYARPGAPVEVVALRARARRLAPLSYDDLGAAGERAAAEGPAVLAEPDCTMWLPEGWTAEVGGGGAWILRRSRS